MSEHRIVLIDGHIIAQFNQGTGWWTASKANNSNESDFAVWPFSESNMHKAQALVGPCSVVETSLKPIQRHDGWLVNPNDIVSVPYNIALRHIARFL